MMQILKTTLPVVGSAALGIIVVNALPGALLAVPVITNVAINQLTNYAVSKNHISFFTGNRIRLVTGLATTIATPFLLASLGLTVIPIVLLSVFMFGLAIYLTASSLNEPNAAASSQAPQPPKDAIEERYPGLTAKFESADKTHSLYSELDTAFSKLKEYLRKFPICDLDGNPARNNSTNILASNFNKIYAQMEPIKT